MKFDKDYNQLKIDCIHKSLIADIYKSMCQMNTTYNVFNDENEANRELTTCLKLLGHDAVYDFRQLNRPIDIFVDNSIIEGKLEPNNSEIDRLIGQITDFLQIPCHIYIVLYGTTRPEIINRIQSQIIDTYSDRVNLVYLLNPQRCRRQIPFEDRTILDNDFIKGYND
jgi:hypothetical protein